MDSLYSQRFTLLRKCFCSLLLITTSSTVNGFSTQPFRRPTTITTIKSFNTSPFSRSSTSFWDGKSLTKCGASKQTSSSSNDINNESNDGQHRPLVKRWLQPFRSNHDKQKHNSNINNRNSGVSQRGWRSRLPTTATSTLLAAAAVVGTILLASSPAAHAAASIANFDLSAVSGGASSLALSTSQLWDSLTETGFYQAFSLVFVSEIGDKTFFIAGLLAMKTSRVISFVGSMAALAAMTLVSVVIGQIFHAVPSGIADGIPLDDVAAILAFTFFGIKTLKEALEIDGDSTGTMDEELAEAKETVEGSQTIKQETPWAQIASIFALVFAAEFGDRSFLSTIALSAAQNPVSVAGGAIAAHAVATGIAVSGGSYVAKLLSEKVIGLIGGTLFLVFAVTTALGIF